MSTHRPSMTRKDLLPCSLLVILHLFLFREILFGGHILFGADFVQIHLPMKQFLYDEIANHGSIPYWNPFIFSGIPYWAHFESTIFYPLGALFWIMAPERAYGYTVFLHLCLAGIFIYLLAKSLGFRRSGAFVAGVIYSFNGFILPTLFDGQLYRIQAYAWIPLIIYFLNRALTVQISFYHAALAGACWGIQLLAGAPQDAFYTMLAAMLFLGCDILGSLKDIHRSLSTLAIAVLFMAVGLGIAAIQVVPATEFVRLSVRAVLNTYELVTLGSYPPQGIITALLPNFFGDYGKETFWVSDVPWTIPLYNLYIGVPPLVALFFISYHPPDKRKIILFSAALACVAVILAFGKNTPIYQFAYLFPGFDKIRAPAKIIILWAFALAVLAGKSAGDFFAKEKALIARGLSLPLCLVLVLVCLDLLFRIDKSIVMKCLSPFVLAQAIPSRMAEAGVFLSGEFHRLTLLSAATLFLIYLRTRLSLRAHLFMALFCGILILDLGYTNWRAVRHKDEIYRWAEQAKKASHAMMEKEDGLFRVGSLKFGMGANFDMYLGYQSVGGYGPLYTHRYYEYINQYRFYRRQVPEGWIIFFYEPCENSILMDLLNVKYEISHETRTFGLRETHLPRCFLVPRFEYVDNKDMLDALIKPEFDPTQVVFFEKGASDITLIPERKKSPVDPGRTDILSYRPDSITLSVHATSPALLFLSEAHYPGWKAYVNGEPRPILRGNYLFRVIEIPKGAHLVQFSFEPLSVKVGISLTLLTLLLLLLWSVARFRARRR